MENMDLILKVFACVVTATVTAVGVLKSLFPDFVKGREPMLALLLPVLFGVLYKSTGQFAEFSYAGVIIFSFIAGLSAQLTHDKAVNPLFKKAKDGDGK